MQINKRLRMRFWERSEATGSNLQTVTYRLCDFRVQLKPIRRAVFAVHSKHSDVWKKRQLLSSGCPRRKKAALLKEEMAWTLKRKTSNFLL